MGFARIAALLAALSLPLSGVAAAKMDPRNPTCPERPDWGSTQPMQFSVEQRDGKKVLVAQGLIDDALLPRLNAALESNKPVDEIWFRSPGGNARVGNQAGMAIRKLGIPTRIPAGWACFSACNFLFMGGPVRRIGSGRQGIARSPGRPAHRLRDRRLLAVDDDHVVDRHAGGPVASHVLGGDG